MSEPTAAQKWAAVANDPSKLIDERNALRNALIEVRRQLGCRSYPFCDDIRSVIAKVVPLLLCVLLSGCVAPIDPAQPVKPDERKPASGELSDIVYRSLQDRDVLRAKKLREIKGQPWDSARIKRIESAGAEASRETWAPVAAALAERLDRIPQTDQAAFDAVLEEIAVGSEKAGGK